MMPSTSMSVTGGDEVRARDGMSCRQGSYVGPTFDVGVSLTPFNSTSSALQSALQVQSFNSLTTQGQGAGVYARVVVPFGRQPERLDCGRLFNLEIERLQMELQKMKESGSAGVIVN